MPPLLNLVRKMLGASAGAAGRSGYVPAPASGQQDRVLFGDGTWRNIGSLTYKGAVAYGSLPASSTSAGDYYVLSSAGTAYTISWAIGDMAIWNGSVWQKVTPGTTQIGQGGTGAATAAAARDNLSVFSKDDIVNRLRPMQGGLAFDGQTPLAKTTHTIGANIGTGDFTVSCFIRVPNDSSAVDPVWHISTSSAPSGVINNGVSLILVNDAFMFQSANAAGTSGISQVSSGRSLCWGRWVHVVFVRTSGSSVPAVYLNSVSQAISVSGVGITAEAINSTYLVIGNAAGYTTSRVVVGGLQIFNRALSASDIEELGSQYLKELDKWGSLTAIYGPQSFEGGVDSWTAEFGAVSAPTTVGGQTSIQAIASGGATQLRMARTIPGLVAGKKYRVSFDLYVPSQGGNTQVALISGTGNTTLAYHAPAAATWTSYNTEVILPASPSGIKLALYTSGFSGLITTGSSFAIKNLSVTMIGCILAADHLVGVGYQVPDISVNNLHGDVTTTGVSHVIEKYDGLHTIVKTLAHSDISSTAATTALLTLPKNCGIVEVEWDRTAAFDSGVTADLGITGNQAKFVSAQSLAATGIVWTDSLSKASESNSGNTTVWIKKSGSTTVGSVTVRITYRIRNK